jgi:hypothetical protein
MVSIIIIITKEVSMTDRNDYIGPMMVIIDRVIRREMEELGVPPQLMPNCLWAVKKYMRKALRDLTAAELEVYRDFISKIAGTEAQLAAMISQQPELILPNDMLDLIRLAINGYLNYKKAGHVISKPLGMGKLIKLD